MTAFFAFLAEKFFLKNLLLRDLFADHAFFQKLAADLPEKSVFSGMANSSAKLGLLAHFFEHSPQFSDTKNILITPATDAETAEFSALLPLFLDAEKYRFHFLPREKNRDEKKIEWTIALAQSKNSPKKNIFLMADADARTENFTELSALAREQILLKKGDKISPIRLFNRLIEIGFEVSPDISLEKGSYRRSGDTIDLFPVGAENPFKIEIEFDEIKNMWSFCPRTKKILKSFSRLSIFPAKNLDGTARFFELFSKNDLIVTDDIDDFPSTATKKIAFAPFPTDDDETHFQMRFLSVLKFYNLFDLLADLRTKLRNHFRISLFSKRISELENIFLEEKIPFSTEEKTKKGISLIDASKSEVMPPSFQHPDQKILFLTDREIFQLRRNRRQKSLENINLEFLTSLKMGDFVVHLDHGIGQFLGVVEQEIDGVTREYLEIAYRGTDRLFVPVDQADKVSRFLCEEGKEPKLSRLGSAEWENIQRKAKKETEKIAKELLKLYAERERARKIPFLPDTPRQIEFEKTFPYTETPGQMAAIADTKKDMESPRPMDRLVCGDVGFGKTEVAMRAAFKCVENHRQVALISPVTILTQQHFESFQKRMKDFGVRIAVLSRFKTPAEQKVILEDLKKGKIDIVVGTHRLLGKDVAFHHLGLLIVDEEQRFGVKQKEKLKAMRKNVDILTLTATPIPRTLNMALNKLRDISTITTPPPGRLPVATEVRKYSDRLVVAAIEKELSRGGQVYFLHNRVQTIESMAEKIRQLVPAARVVVGHGQLAPADLEKRILDFKHKKYDILVSSTIIENGIDLPNANTMIVMNAERFGLSQLYQLRGRIGRGKRQSFAYFLYQTQKLSVEAKKRLRAIVEASELGSGFQISMRDLEIRGAGDVLGVSQSGTANVVGVSHFMRLLQETVRQMQTGEKAETAEVERDVSVDLPVSAFIPSFYIADSKEKILAYQNLAAVKTPAKLREIADDFAEEYGKIPREVRNLLKIIDLKIAARAAGVLAIRSVAVGRNAREIHLVLGKRVGAANIMNLLAQQQNWMISGDTLKRDFRDLGIDFLGEIKKALGFLAGKRVDKK